MTTTGNGEHFFRPNYYAEEISNYGVLNGRCYSVLYIDILDSFVQKHMALEALRKKFFANFFV